MTIDKDTLLIVKSDQFGADEPDLGAKLTQAFFACLLESGSLPDEMIFMARGVFLATEGTPVLDMLEKIAGAGTRISSCGTCLDYYDRREKLVVGVPGTMKGTVEAIQTHAKVVQP
ncbi:MAG: sulfurtransferase-like selenium metabolism protein YedF [Deltaproteobacteria bacterium]|nr:sulfurtransferase-like selenium metabolism protein YedF [Deltaproteobacteria bacterium]